MGGRVAMVLAQQAVSDEATDVTLPTAGRLSVVFSAHLIRGALRPRVTDLEAELEDRLAAGRVAWPDVELDALAFMRHLAERTTEGRLPAADRSGDLFLACACAHGDARAIAAFDRALRPEIARSLARGGSPPAFTDDVLQI